MKGDIIYPLYVCMTCGDSYNMPYKYCECERLRGSVEMLQRSRQRETLVSRLARTIKQFFNRAVKQKKKENVMPNPTGKAGTITAEEFETLKAAAEQYGAKMLAQKVSKVCGRIASVYSHEFTGSAVAAAWNGLATRISNTLGTTTRPVNTETFSFLSGLVKTYGPELVVQKLAKIAQRSGNTADSASLNALFPRANNGRNAA